MPKGTSMFKPTHIEVVVLDPVDTSLWKVKNINKHTKNFPNLLVEYDRGKKYNLLIKNRYTNVVFHLVQGYTADCIHWQNRFFIKLYDS